MVCSGSVICMLGVSNADMCTWFHSSRLLWKALKKYPLDLVGFPIMSILGL